jgi:hypothetical protein
MQQENERLPVAAVARVIPEDLEDPAGLAAAAALAVAVPTKEEVEGA